MMSLTLYASVLAMVLGLVAGQSDMAYSFDGSNCTGGSTTLPQCNYIASKLNVCNPSLPYRQRQECYCGGDVFSAIFGCESEQRLCLRNNAYDAEVSTILSYWHIECYNFTTTPYATPPVSQLTFTANDPVCENIKQVCLVGASSYSQCYQSYYTNTPKFSSCVCDPAYLSIASVCEYDGNATCKGVPASIESVDGYGYCKGYETILTTHPAITASSQASSSGVSAPGSTVAPTFRPAPSATAPTATATHSGAQQLHPGRIRVMLALFVSTAVLPLL